MRPSNLYLALMRFLRKAWTILTSIVRNVNDVSGLGRIQL